MREDGEVPMPLREPSLLAFRCELGVLWRAGLRCRGRVFLIATVLAVGMAVQIGRRAPRPHAKAVVRFSENWPDGAMDNRRFSRVELAHYVHGTVFSASNLVDVYRRQLHEGPVGTADELGLVSSLRESIHVDVLVDRVVALFNESDRRRSALIEITFTSETSEYADRMVRVLGRLLVDQGMAAHESSMATMKRVADYNSRVADRSFLVAQEDATVRLRDWEARLMARRKTGFEDGALAHALLHRARIRNFREEVERALREQDKNSSIQMTLLSVRSVEPWPRQRTLAVGWMAAFLAGLPMSILMVGAFSGRIADSWDVACAGGAPLVAVTLSAKQPDSNPGVAS